MSRKPFEAKAYAPGSTVSWRQLVDGEWLERTGFVFAEGAALASIWVAPDAPLADETAVLLKAGKRERAAGSRLSVISVEYATTGRIRAARAEAIRAAGALILTYNHEDGRKAGPYSAATTCHLTTCDEILTAPGGVVGGGEFYAVWSYVTAAAGVSDAPYGPRWCATCLGAGALLPTLQAA